MPSSFLAGPDPALAEAFSLRRSFAGAMWSTATSLSVGVAAILLGGTGIWLQSEAHQRQAREGFQKMTAKLDMLEALAAKKTSTMKTKIQEEFPSFFGYHEADTGAVTVADLKARHGAADFASEHKILLIVVVVDVLLFVIALVWYFFFRATHPPIVMKPKGALTVKVVSASNLPNLDENAKVKTDVTDAFVEVKVSGKAKNTKTIKDSLNPTWNEPLGPFELDFEDKKKAALMKTLSVKVYDKDGWFSSTPLVGELNLDCQEFVRSILEYEAVHRKDTKPPPPFQIERALDCHLQDRSEDKDKPPVPAKIKLEASYKPHEPPPSKTPAAKPVAPAAKATPAPATVKAAAPAAKTPMAKAAAAAAGK